jgi:hypothetical protein
MNKFKQQTLLLLLTFVLIHQSFAQKTTQEITNKFFALYAKDTKGAIQYAFSTNKWLDGEQEAITGLYNKLKNAIDQSGQYDGYELVSTKTVGQNIVMQTFVVKYDRLPFRFVFLFYKAKDIWKVQNFSFDDEVDKELK